MGPGRVPWAGGLGPAMVRLADISRSKFQVGLLRRAFRLRGNYNSNMRSPLDHPALNAHPRAPIAAIGRAIQRAMAMGPADATSGQRRREMVVLEKYRRQIEALQARYLAEDDRALGQGRVGESELLEPTVDWVVAHHGISNGAAYTRLQMARRLSLLPHTAQRFQEGMLNEQQARAICDAMTDLGRCRQGSDSEVRESVESDLNRKARTMTARELYIDWARQRYQMDQEAGLAAEREERDKSWGHHMRTPWGRHRLAADLDDETGTTFVTAWDVLARKRGADDQRPAKLRRAQALGEMGRLVLQWEELPRRHGSPTQLVLRCPVETLTLKPGSPPAELDGGGVVSGETVRRLMSNATITRVLVDKRSGDVLDVGAATRVVPARMWKALEERDRHCQAPGCTVPAALCEPHHKKPVAEGGRTTMPNLTLLCRVHHPQTYPNAALYRKGAPPGPSP